ncbi:UDP-2,3-diacylglucosamine diphosphatase [Thiorhodococcus mannitoliphagus]|uniref:UDP-2,3-diacylglucosamine diphosphatase n=1 Tax=Thiorhodococcus mannitoliphagus TaxID=329406 RepID=A0A6P1DQU3_9GAMM|nr:UDP-2,3-diacylglucosamine diphosphatase [Thiorhodococcus mannitoliphagus]NEX19301.1 UDP-2,3-diacylglucosamine diphosphatase [Thiorhodococcus mannitoliphagus]
MSEIKRMHPLKYRSIFLSDIHLGFRGCQAQFLIDFLQSTQSKQLYLVGDIIDLWAMKNGVYWPEAHNQIVREIFAKARQGTEVIYIPGNHDERFRDHLEARFGDIVVKDEVVHRTADGRRFMVLHGDKFDGVVQHSPWLAELGSHAYDKLLALNVYLSRVRALFGMKYWSLAGYLKHKVKNAVSYIGNYERAVATEAGQRALDGMICGHIHHAEMREIQGVTYCNCGDWVESCTALVEHHDGRLELLRWTDAYPESIGAAEPLVALAQAS